MKTFKIDNNIEIVCEWKKTRTAFKHEATLLLNGIERESVKICYQNRTWEAYEFDSVIEKLVAKTKLFTEAEKKLVLSGVRSINENAPSPFKGIAIMAAMGEIFGKDKKEKNDWKARMLKAGLENRGLIMPEDWDSLSEDEKERRLNGAIAELK